MIKAADLKQTDNPGYRFSPEGAVGLTLRMVKNALERENESNYGLPIEIREEQIKSGGLFNSSVTDCLILTNTEHPTDYFKYCLTLRRQGKQATLTLQYYGTSVLTGKAHQTEERKKTLTGRLTNAVMGVNQAAFDAEYDYYAMLENLFNGIVE